MTIQEFLRHLFSRSEIQPFDERLNYFTPRAQQVLALARQEADRLNHSFVGTEHLLLGLVKLGQGVAVNVLQNRGLNLDSIAKEIENQMGVRPIRKELISDRLATPRVWKVLKIASKEAKALNHTYVGTEHILLGILDAPNDGAAAILKKLGVDIDQIRQEILKELGPFSGL